MKYRVLRDFGVDVAGVHYAHGAEIDSEKAVPAVPDEVPEELRANYAAGLQEKTKADLDAAAKDGFLVDDGHPAAATLHPAPPPQKARAPVTPATAASFLGETTETEKGGR